MTGFRLFLLSLANSYPSIRIHGALTVPLSPSLANNLGCSHSVLDSHTVRTSYHGQSLFTFYCNTSTFVHCPVRSDSTKAGTTFCPAHCPLSPCSGWARSRHFAETCMSNHNRCHLYLNFFFLVGKPLTKPPNPKSFAIDSEIFKEYLNGDGTVLTCLEGSLAAEARL